ncbi:MAG: DegT/DnrJ/EryC1/StrS family aminotransferase [Planctomycetota bacterium]|jgi:dTDP-4-amino-4,6-dideoxygalactose transaminase
MSTPIQVPLLDLKAQYASIRDEIDQAIRPVLESQYFILGPTVQELEGEVAAYCRCPHAISCASGSDAILLALMALGVGPGDEIICPAYTFFATGGSIARLGAVPIFADIDPVTYNIDPAHVRRLAATCTRLKAIMPVHLFGQSADLDALLALGDELGVPVIEDAAQAIGTLDDEGRPAGSRGVIGCFSFFPTKNLGGYGDGGIMTTGDDELADGLRMLRNHGGRNKYYNELLGMNSRLDALQAAVLRVKLRHLDAWHDGRCRNADHYDRAFADRGARSSLSPIDDGGLPLRTPHRHSAPARHIYNQYVIRVPAAMRDALREHLKEQRIGSEVYYPVPIHLQPCMRELGGKPGDLPESERAAAETIALPIFPELTTEQLDHVANTVCEYVEQHAPVAARTS